MKKCNYEDIVRFVKHTFKADKFIPLHEPKFIGNEKKYLIECIDSTFVSSVGKFVDEFEKNFAQITDSKKAVATVNGTSALHISLLLSGVKNDDEVITQAVTFIATCNAIKYCFAKPVFVDVDLDTLGLSPKALKNFLEKNCEVVNGECINKTTKKVIRACVAMHTFGLPCRILEITEICKNWNIKLIEDCAESLGSYYDGTHTGNFADISAFSFNGNKIVTSGGGGAIISNDENLAKKAKHITTTAKVPHPYKFVHDMVGYNYRMPNINAALIVAQLENLEMFLKSKRELADIYKEFFKDIDGCKFVEESKNSKSNYWLNTIIFDNIKQRDEFLIYSNNNGVMTRPIWTLMNELDMYKECQNDGLQNSKYLNDRVVNLPSSARI